MTVTNQYSINPASNNHFFSNQIPHLDQLKRLVNLYISEGTEKQNSLKLFQERISIIDIYEKDEGQYCIDLKIDLSHHDKLKRSTELASDKSKFDNNIYVTKSINEFYLYINAFSSDLDLQLSFRIVDIDLSQNHVSGLSVLATYPSHLGCSNTFENLPAKEDSSYKLRMSVLFVDIQETIAKLNFSHTKFSNIALSRLRVLKSLEEIQIGFCPNSQRFKDLVVPSVKKITLVGSPISNSSNLLKKIETIFPNVTKIEFTQNIKGKFLGLTDVVTQVSVVTPVVLKCGHIFSKHVVEHRTFKKCAICNSSDVSSAKTAAIFRTRLDKELAGRDGSTVKWKVALLDYGSKLLSDRVFYHDRCREAFNLETLAECFQFDLNTTDQEIVKYFDESIVCPGCFDQGYDAALKPIRIYPNITETQDVYAESQQQYSLGDIEKYIIDDDEF
ncbi:MAG: hypothetical protein VX777_04860 [Chlamydiota bacterium]|nr:hypothetical protein [Chlamydiota bacterium]